MRLSDIEAGWDKQLDLINTECSEILDVYRNVGRFLYRGINTLGAVLVDKSPTDRHPRDSSKQMQDFFDSKLSELGMVAIRSNSIFATSKMSWTKIFGTPYIIFPKNGFKYTFTTEKDITFGSWKNLITIAKATKIDSEMGKASFMDRESFSKYKTLDEVVNTLKEKYPKGEYIQSLTPDTLITTGDVKAMYKPQNTNLEEALRKQLEVLIHGEYYAVNTQIFTSAELNQKFKIRTRYKK